MKPTEKTAAQKLAEVLDRECPDEEVGRVLRECLTATSVNRAGAIEVDYKTRLAAAQFITAQRHGLPVRREEILQVNVDADSTVGLRERLAHSPALRKVLQSMLDDVESGNIIDASP